LSRVLLHGWRAKSDRQNVGLACRVGSAAKNLFVDREARRINRGRSVEQRQTTSSSASQYRLVIIGSRQAGRPVLPPPGSSNAPGTVDSRTSTTWLRPVSERDFGFQIDRTFHASVGGCHCLKMRLRRQAVGQLIRASDTCICVTELLVPRCNPTDSCFASRRALWLIRR
jgi:hypothetical protein